MADLFAPPKGLDAFAIDKQIGINLPDFYSSKDEVAPIGNKASNNNMAAYASVLGSVTPGDVVSNYLQANNEQSLIGQSQTQTALIGKVLQATQQSYIPGLADTLANPNISDADKQKASDSVLNINSPTFSAANILSAKAITAPVSNTNAEEDQVRVNIGDITHSMNAQKILQQSLLNKAAAQGDPTTKDKVTGFIRGLFPGVRNAEDANIAAGMDPDHATSAYLSAFFTLPGNYRDGLRDKIARMAPADQATTASNIADIINNHYGVLSSNPDYLAKRELMQDLLSTGGYNGLEDNVNGVLDAISIASAGESLIKGGLNAVRGVRAAKSAEELDEAFINSYKNQTKGFKPDSYTDPANPTGPGSGGSGKGTTFALDGPETKVGTTEAETSNVTRDFVKGGAQPASVISNLKDTNVDSARGLFDAVDKDTTGGKVADAVYNTSRQDAIAGDMLPEVGHADGSVKAKVSNPDGVQQLADIRSQVPDELIDFANHDGLTQYTRNEIAKTSSWKVNNMEDAIAMSPRPEMFQIQPGTRNLADTSTGFTIRGVYGPANHGYSNPQDAMDLANFALRKTGIPSEDITLLKRSGGVYVPTTLDAEKGNIDPGFRTDNARDMYNSGQYATATVKGQDYHIIGTINPEDPMERTVHAFTPDGKKIGEVKYSTNPDELDNPDLKVAKDYRRKGVASAMYSYIEKHGDNVPDADTQQLMRTTSGQSFRTSLANGSAPKVNWKNVDGGDYLIGIDHTYKVNSADYEAAGAAEHLNVKNNFLDRVALTDGRQGSAANTILDIGSMLHPVIYKSSLVAADKAKYFEKQLLNQFGNEFATPFSKLPTNRQRMLENEIYKANETSKAYDFISLKAAGLTDNEIQIMKGLERSQNILFYFRNQAFGAYLDRQGFQMFNHEATGTFMPARPVKKGSLGVPDSGMDVYDPTTDRNIRMSKQAIEDTYTKGGTLAELRHPFEDDSGSIVKHVVDGNTQGGGYLSKIIPGKTSVLHYRPGYFGTEYNQPYMVVENLLDKSGKKYGSRAIATAADQKTAKLHTNRLNAQSDFKKYQYRKNNDNQLNRDAATDYDVAVANGQSSFRRRGKRLEDTNSNVTNLSKLNIKNPAEVFTRSARALSNKVAYGDVIASQDVRNVSQYGQYFPKNDIGRTMVPGDKRLIRYRDIGNENPSAIADARTNVQYTNYLRTGGYINLLDDATKGAMRSLADYFGAKDLSYAEHLFSGLSDISIGRVGKTAAYTAFLALSPLRQFVVQSAQISLLTATNPSWMATSFIPQMMYMSMRQMGLDAMHPVAHILSKGFGLSATAKDADVIWKEFLRSGVSSAIDSNNMVSGVLSDMASRMVSNTSKHITAPVRAVKGVMHMARLVGFDAGEWINSTASWMAHRDKAAKAGLDVHSPRVLDDITATARNYTGAMNHAGDMPTNQNSLSLIAQFSQQTQKILGNLTANRIIPWQTKAAMTAVLLGLFGIGDLAWSKWVNDVIPPDPNDPSHQGTKEALSQGLEGWMLNRLISAGTGKHTDLDWRSSLTPFNVQGTADLIHTLLTTNAGGIMAKIPAGSLFFGSNPRITNFLKDVARYTHLSDDWATNPTTFSEVATNFAKISSGYSSYAKATYALAYGKKISSLGRVTDSNVTTPEALAALIGVQTRDEERSFDVQSQLTATKTQKQADFNKYYNDWKVHLNTEYPDEDSAEFMNRTLSEFSRIYGGDPEYMHWLDQKLKSDLADGDASVYNNLLRMSNLYGKKDIHAIIDETPFKNEQNRQDLKNTLDYLDTSDPTER